MKWLEDPKRLAGAGLLAAAALLAGCAGPYIMDNQVQSFSALPALPPAPTYRFERLLSQQAPGQVPLEAMADAALNRAGLRRDDANPRFSVQVSARSQQIVSPWADPWGEPWDGFGWGRRGWGRRHGFGLTGAYESPYYEREVAVIVREIATQKVVFESHAINDGPWREVATVLPAMFQAAMQGFPNPPPGPRRVEVALPG